MHSQQTLTENVLHLQVSPQTLHLYTRYPACAIVRDYGVALKIVNGNECRTSELRHQYRKYFASSSQTSGLRLNRNPACAKVKECGVAHKIVNGNESRKSQFLWHQYTKPNFTALIDLLLHHQVVLLRLDPIPVQCTNILVSDNIFFKLNWTVHLP